LAVLQVPVRVTAVHSVPVAALSVPVAAAVPTAHQAVLPEDDSPSPCKPDTKRPLYPNSKIIKI